MTGRTQLIIDSVEVVLPKDFSTTVKRENSFFTKNGEYTYDCTLRLDNDTNRRLYGFLQRVNKADALPSNRSAVLIADGRVYCRGTEVITGWTDDEVTIQIVSGNSELNYFIGDDVRIDNLNLGAVTATQVANYVSSVHQRNGYDTTDGFDFCLPVVFDDQQYRPANAWYYPKNSVLPNMITQATAIPEWAQSTFGSTYNPDIRPQPFLCAFLRRLITALGYTVGTNQLEQTQFRNLFLVNAFTTWEYAKMLPGWTVRDFLEAVEQLCNCVFLVDNLQHKVDILQKPVFYASTTPKALQNVIDEYESQESEDVEPDFSTANLEYDVPDTSYYRKAIVDRDRLSQYGIVARNDIDDVNSEAGQTSPSNRCFWRDTTTERYYIRRRGIDIEEMTVRTLQSGAAGAAVVIPNLPESARSGVGYSVLWLNRERIREVDEFRDLARQDATGTLSLQIIPAQLEERPVYWQIYDNGTTDGKRLIAGTVITVPSPETMKPLDSDETDPDEDAVDDSFEGAIENETAAADNSPCQLYAAFYNGLKPYGPVAVPCAYTDAYHAMNVDAFFNDEGVAASSRTYTNFVGSLRLNDVDEEVFAGVYRIATTRQVTFETFDPNLADPHSLFVIRNKRYVCREIEETITAEGRRPRWKIVCHPITISDTAANQRWVLDQGVWDDGGLWLDDGRWNDN